MTKLIDFCVVTISALGIAFCLMPQPVEQLTNLPARFYMSFGVEADEVHSMVNEHQAVAPEEGEAEAVDPEPEQPAIAQAETWRKIDLVATAYNSVPAQTDSTPDIAAWGDKLKPGMKAIAVSRDLLKMGWKRGTRVRISGFEGEYVVLDKMNKRWKKRIDVYMGLDIKAARRFGKRNVVVHYQPEEPLLVADNS